MTRKAVGRSVSVVLLFICAIVNLFSQVPLSKHVVLVIDENSSFKDVMANMPWLVGQGYANGYAANYKSDTGGSLMDYLWLASGSCHSKVNCTLPPGTHDFNCSGNDCFYPGTNTADPITDDNIFRELNNAGVSWKVYAQSYSQAGGDVTTPDNGNGTSYYRRHNGATWYSDVLNNVNGSAEKVVDLSQLSLDLAAGNLPRFLIIVPDGNHDAHDCPVGMSNCSEPDKLWAADQFLSGTLTPILSTSPFQPGGDGLVIVTFDECGGGTNDGCWASVYTALIGPKVLPHTVSAVAYKHENTLRTMLEALGITNYPGASATAASMSDFFAVAQTNPQVTIDSPSDGANVSSPVTIYASAIPASGRSIAGWYVYVDGAPAYHTGAANSISPTLNISVGTHSVIARAWDSVGAFGDQTISLTVHASQPTVTVSTPLDGANLGSPANIRASASPTAGHSITGWWIYADGVGVYNGGPKNAINTSLKLGLGAHSLLIRAWDTSGAYGDQKLNITVSKKPSIQVYTPSNGSNVISPIDVQASASPDDGFQIGGWYVYLDGAPVYHTGPTATGSIHTNVPASAGAHTVIVRVWDSSGAYGDQTVPLQVQPVAVNISSPANGASVSSPMNIQATAVSAHPVAGWHIYVDSVDVFAQNNGNPVNANLNLGSGTHTILMRAWDNTGAYGDQSINITVP